VPLLESVYKVLAELELFQRNVRQKTKPEKRFIVDGSSK
jgi:hypothetical protein